MYSSLENRFVSAEIGLSLFLVVSLSVECVSINSLLIDKVVQHYEVSIVRRITKVGHWSATREQQQSFVDICTLNSLQRDKLCKNLLSDHIDLSHDYSSWKMPMQYAIQPMNNGRQIITGAIQCTMDPPTFVYGHIDGKHPQLSRLTLAIRNNDTSFSYRRMFVIAKDDKSPSLLSEILMSKKVRYPYDMRRRTRNSDSKLYVSRFTV